MNIAVILTVLLMCGCKNNDRTITGTLWANGSDNSSVIIEEQYLTDEGKERLNKMIGDGIIYDKDRKAFIVKVSDEQNWGMTSLKVLATPFTIVADGVKYTVVVAVNNPELTIKILEAVLKR